MPEKTNGGYLHPSVAIGVMDPLIGPQPHTVATLKTLFAHSPVGE